MSYARQILVEQRLSESQKSLCPGERERGVCATSCGATASESSTASASRSDVVINTGKLEQQANALASAQASAQRSKRLPSPARLPPPSARTTKGHVADGKHQQQKHQQQRAPPQPAPKAGASGAAASDESSTGWGPFAWLKARVFIYTGLASASPASAADVWPEYDVEAGDASLEGEEDENEFEDAGSTSGVAMDATAGASEEEDDDVNDEGDEDGTARVRSADRVRSSAFRVTDEGVAVKEETDDDEDAGAPLPPRPAATGHTGDEPGSSSAGEDIEDETQVKTKVKGANGGLEEEEEEEPFDINQLHWLLRLFAPPPDHMKRMLEMRESQYRAYGSYGISSSFHSSHNAFCYGSAF